MAEVSLKGVTKKFGNLTALNDVTIDIADGEFFVLLGPTGAGKTTTLRLVAGLERPDEGSVIIGNYDMTRVEPAVRDVAFVFQQYSLYPNLSVYDNLAFPLRAPARRVPEPEIRERIEAIAGMLHISDKLDNRATQLSGGEMQRVAIGRALVRQPSIYLMDEPLSSLDAKLRAELRIELKRIQADIDATLLYVTHDQIEAMTMADRIGILDNGRLIQTGKPREIYTDPRNIYVATRLGQPTINLVPEGLLELGSVPAGTKTVGVRTEHVEIRRVAKDKAQGIVNWVEHLGDQNHLHVSVGDHALVTLADPQSDLKRDDSVNVQVTKPLFFGADGERMR